MPAFQFTAIDKTGTRKKGVRQGDSAKHVRQLLRENGLTPLKVDEVKQKTKAGKGQSFFTRSIPQSEVALMTRQLATLVRAGLPLDDALKTLAEQIEHKQVLSMVQSIHAKVSEGHSLSEGMSQFPNAFSELYLATISAGEHSRDLALVLERLADYVEQRQELTQKIKLAMLYPIILSVVALLVTGGLLVFVVPEIVQIFENSKQELPTITRVLIWVSDFVQQWWFVCFLVISALIVFLKWYLSKERPRYRFHQILLTLPIIKNLIKQSDASRFTHTLGILLASGVPMLEALKIATSATNSLPIRESLDQASVKVREGESLHTALRQHTQLPPMTIHLIANGEANLESMLESAANAGYFIKWFLGLLEPILSWGLIVPMLYEALKIATDTGFRRYDDWFLKTYPSFWRKPESSNKVLAWHPDRESFDQASVKYVKGKVAV